VTNKLPSVEPSLAGYKYTDGVNSVSTSAIDPSSAGKKMAESEIKKGVLSSMWRAGIYYLGIPLLIMGGILLIFVFI